MRTRWGDDISFMGLPDMCMDSKWDMNYYHDDVEFYDDTTDELLDSTLVHEGCQEELRRFSEMQVYEYVHRESLSYDALTVNVRWVHVNTGTPSEPKVRCRLVAQEFKDGENKDELFAGIPPVIHCATYPVNVRLRERSSSVQANDS